MVTTDSPPPAASRFASLSALREQHAELLRSVSPEQLADAQRELVLDFLRRGAATGAVLDAPKDRQIAQGLLDYWKATLYTQRRSAQETAQTERDLSSIPLARLADFDEQNLAQLAAAAEEA